MNVPWRNALARRILILIGLATVLPLTLLMAAVLFQVYGATSAQTYATLEETSRRYAAEFESRLDEKLGLMGAIALTIDPRRSLGDPSRILALDPDLRAVWVRTEANAAPDEPADRRALYEAVRATGTEVLSAPDLAQNQASLGVPLRDGDRTVGMVAVTFSLEYFQKVVAGIHLFRTGYALLVSHQGYRIAHPDPSLIGVRIGNDVAPSMAQEMVDQVASGQPFWFEKTALLTGKWSRQFYTPVRAGRAPNPWFLAVVVPADEATSQLNLLFLVLVGGSLVTLVLVGGVTVWATRKVVRALADQEEALEQKTVRLEASLADLEQAQKKVINSEKLAVLGQLTATIAHEINTPLGAIRSSATFLNQVIGARVEDLPDRFRQFSSEDLALYKALVIQRGDTLLSTQGGEDRKRRRSLAQVLRNRGTPDAEGLADDIVFLVPAGEDATLLEAVARGQAGVVRLAAQTVALVQSGTIILQSADRAAATVTALVDYARVGAIPTQNLVDPAHELEVILTLYYGLSKKGVEVVREFEPGVVVLGDRDRLNQVWVNLINNGLQAMCQRGRLVLRVKNGPGGPEVSVANDGPPIPPDLRERIFEPFFTTKKAGEGTGLGLDICRRTIEAHQGTLDLTQEGPLTVFTAHFPPPPRSLP